MRSQVQVLAGPPYGLTRANAGYRVRNSLARVGVGSRTLTWLPLLVMSQTVTHRGLSDAAFSLECMIRAFCRTPQGSPGCRSRSPPWHREAADRPRRTQPRLVCRARARRGDDRHPVGHQHVAEPPQEPMVLSSGDPLRCAVSATLSVVQVGPYLGGSDIDRLDRACGSGQGPRTSGHRACGQADQSGPLPHLSRPIPSTLFGRNHLAEGGRR